MRLSSVLACLALLHLPGLPFGAQQAPTPTPGQLVVLGADGEPVADASVTVIQPSRAGLSPVDAFLVRSETAENGVVEDAVPRLHGLTVIIDDPAHLPFVNAYPSRPLPEVIRLQPGRTAKGVVREAAGGRSVTGASVCASWRDAVLPDWFGTLRRCTDSGERGAFELPGLAAGNLQATAEAAGFETGAGTIEQGRRASRVEFELVASEQPPDEAPSGPAGAGGGRRCARRTRRRHR